MVDVLEKIATKHPDVEPNEVIDIIEDGATTVPENNVFCFSGHVASSAGGLKSGFIIAKDDVVLADFLSALGFVVESATSLSELRRALKEMCEVLQISANDEQYDTHVINLKSQR